MKLTVQFTVVRETKGAVRYEEIDSKGKLIGCLPSGAVSPAAQIGMIYLRKAHLGGTVPPSISVTVESI